MSVTSLIALIGAITALLGSIPAIIIAVNAHGKAGVAQATASAGIRAIAAHNNDGEAHHP